MRYRFFIIPIGNVCEAEEELNRFLCSSRVLTVHREFVAAGEHSFWAMAVEYLPGQSDLLPSAGRGGKPKTDYREVLSEKEFALFAKLRNWRKEAAAKESVPVYTLFTNEQLAEIARQGIGTLHSLRAVEGVGDAKVAKYGQAVIAIVQEEVGDEAHRQPVPPDR